VIVAAELTQDANDLQQLESMLKATITTLAHAGIQARPEVLLADSGYWSIANLTQIQSAPELYIPPAKHARQGKPRKDSKPSAYRSASRSASRSDPLRVAMRAKLASEDGKARSVEVATVPQDGGENRSREPSVALASDIWRRSPSAASGANGAALCGPSSTARHGCPGGDCGSRRER
jgi:hypothetical protein